MFICVMQPELFVSWERLSQGMTAGILQVAPGNACVQKIICRAYFESQSGILNMDLNSQFSLKRNEVELLIYKN